MTNPAEAIAGPRSAEYRLRVSRPLLLRGECEALREGTSCRLFPVAESLKRRGKVCWGGMEGTLRSWRTRSSTLRLRPEGGKSDAETRGAAFKDSARRAVKTQRRNRNAWFCSASFAAWRDHRIAVCGSDSLTSCRAAKLTGALESRPGFQKASHHFRVPLDLARGVLEQNPNGVMGS
jgi:hypothetical protein